jgi:hypothetical protein
MSHTPAPWEIDDDTLDVIALTIGDAPAHIACQPDYPSGRPLDKEEITANLRLIAAAPELLAACKLALTAGDQQYVQFILRDVIEQAEGVTTEGTDGKERSLD